MEVAEVPAQENLEESGAVAEPPARPQEASQLSLDDSDVSLRPPRAKRPKTKRLAIDRNIQLNQDEMRRMREERGLFCQELTRMNPGAKSADQLLRAPTHRRNCGKEIRRGLKRAYDDGQCDFDVQDENVPAPEVPQEEPNDNLLQVPNESLAETTLSTIRDTPLPNMGHSRSRTSAALGFSSDDESGSGRESSGNNYTFFYYFDNYFF